MEQAEFARRIEVYLELDAPHVVERRHVAEALAGRLFQYVRQPEEPVLAQSATLSKLLPDLTLLVFTAAWDGNSQGYADVVREAVGERPAVIEVDIDDPIGSAIARVTRVLNTPAVVLFKDSRWGTPVIGRRSVGELRDVLEVT